MSNKFKCRSCGAIVEVSITSPGENTICKNCGVFNNVPEPGNDPNVIPIGGVPSDPRLIEVAAAPEKRISLGNWNITEMFSEAFRIYFKHFLTIVLIYAVVQLPAEAFNYFIDSMFGIDRNLDMAVAFMAIIGGLFSILFNILITPLSMAAGSYLVFREYLGEKTGLFESYQIIFSRWKSLIPTYILAGIALLLMAITVIGIPVAIYFSIMWTAVIPVILLERHRISGNIDRSKKLADGNFWRIFGLYFLFFIVLMVPILGAVFVVAPFFIEFGENVKKIVMPFLMLIFIAPTIILPAIIYLDFRARKEGYDFEMLRRDVRRLEQEANLGD